MNQVLIKKKLDNIILSINLSFRFINKNRFILI